MGSRSVVTAKPGNREQRRHPPNKRKPPVRPITLPRWLDQWDASWTPNEVGALLHVHPEVIRRWIRAGKIPATPLPGTRLLRIRVADLKAWIEGGKLPA